MQKKKNCEHIFLFCFGFGTGVFSVCLFALSKIVADGLAITIFLFIGFIFGLIFMNRYLSKRQFNRRKKKRDDNWWKRGELPPWERL